MPGVLPGSMRDSPPCGPSGSGPWLKPRLSSPGSPGVFCEVVPRAVNLAGPDTWALPSSLGTLGQRPARMHAVRGRIGNRRVPVPSSTLSWAQDTKVTIPDTLPDSCPGSVVVIFLTETADNPAWAHHSDLLLRTMLLSAVHTSGRKPNRTPQRERERDTHTHTHTLTADQATEPES